MAKVAIKSEKLTPFEGSWGQVDKTNGIKFWGSSMVVGPQGEMYYRASEAEEESVVISIDLNHSEHVRRWWPFLRDRRIDEYHDILKRFAYGC